MEVCQTSVCVVNLGQTRNLEVRPAEKGTLNELTIP